MNCEKIQELILTDYLDGQLDAKCKDLVDQHLAGCPGCKEFSGIVGRSVFEPFLKAESLRPPEQVWFSIKENIAAEQPGRSNVFANFLENFQNSVRIPRPAIAFVTAMTLVIVVGTLTRFASHAPVNTNEQVEYMAQMIDASGDVAADDGFGTDEEKYFL